MFAENLRFQTDFENPQKIGSGEFATVFKAKKRTDVSTQFIAIID